MPGARTWPQSAGILRSCVHALLGLLHMGAAAVSRPQHALLEAGSELARCRQQPEPPRKVCQDPARVASLGERGKCKIPGHFLASFFGSWAKL